MRIVVDAMGGDLAPAAPVEGALLAARELGVGVILVGRPDQVREQLRRWGGPADGLPPGSEVVEATDVVGPDEPPVQAVKHKPNSSLVVAMRLLKERRGQALVSAGNTGALMTAGLFILGRIAGVDRPALGSVFPTRSGRGCLLLDLGAVSDCKPRNLLEFGLMGSAYARYALGLERPRVALLNVGLEEVKGNELVRKAYALLKESGLNFIGNVEGRQVPEDAADVVVCDGFTGNILLKFTEGMASAIFGLIREAASRGARAKLGGLLIRPALRRVKGRLDYAEYGGAPLLGLAGVVIKCHGSSGPKAIRNGIRVARDLAAGGLVEEIARGISRLGTGREGEA
ncbi:MAG: phosphate acyltransferase PlsX [Acetobacteraceae bacterium]|nr:phosphate acyltransferase PlsX [Acetobacteraceae bacterium]